MEGPKEAGAAEAQRLHQEEQRHAEEEGRTAELRVQEGHRRNTTPAGDDDACLRG